MSAEATLPSTRTQPHQACLGKAFSITRMVSSPSGTAVAIFAVKAVHSLAFWIIQSAIFEFGDSGYQERSKDAHANLRD